MPTISTVRGSVDSTELGFTLVHEHLFVKNPELEANYPRPEWDEEAMITRAVNGLNALRERGVTTFVDLTVMGLGRDIERVLKVMDGTDMNIVVATGYYTQKDLPLFFSLNGPGRLIEGPEPLEEMFVGDLTKGIAGTGVKAGAIKVVTDEAGITPDIARIMDAAGTAHQQTGAPIFTHTHAAHRTGLLQQEYFRKIGVPLEHIVIGHCGDTTDLDYLRELMDAGSTIGLDRFGMENLLSDEERTEVVVRLVELGYTDRIAMSHDAPFYVINRPDAWRAEHVPNWVTTNISDRIIPALLRRGVGQDTIDRIMIDNPARILSGAR